MRKVILMSVLLGLALTSLAAQKIEDSGDIKVHSETVSVAFGKYKINIDPRGFRFHIVDDAGIVLAPMHQSEGLRLGKEPVFLTEVDPDHEGEFTVASIACPGWIK